MIWFELVQEDSVVLAVRYVSAEVVDSVGKIILVWMNEEMNLIHLRFHPAAFKW